MCIHFQQCLQICIHFQHCLINFTLVKINC
jgi:hypothetical protein